MIDYAHVSRKGKLLISIAGDPGDMCKCSPIYFKFTKVLDGNGTVREYNAMYTYSEMCEMCPVFEALDELYGILAIRPKVRVYDSHISVRWSYLGINVAYTIKLDLLPALVPNPESAQSQLHPEPTPSSTSDLEMRMIRTETECVRLKAELKETDDQLRCVLDSLKLMYARMAILEGVNEVD